MSHTRKDIARDIARARYENFLKVNNMTAEEHDKQTLVAELIKTNLSNLKDPILSQFKPENYAAAASCIKHLAMAGMDDEDHLKILILRQDALKLNKDSISVLAEKGFLNTDILARLLKNHELESAKHIFKFLHHLAKPESGISAKQFKEIIPTIINNGKLMVDAHALLSTKGVLPFEKYKLISSLGYTLRGEMLLAVIKHAKHAKGIREYLRTIATINDDIILKALATVRLNEAHKKLNDGIKLPILDRLILLKDESELRDLFLTEMREYAGELAQSIKHLDNNGILTPKNINVLFKHLASLSKINSELASQLTAEEKFRNFGPDLDFAEKLRIIWFGRRELPSTENINAAISAVRDTSEPAPTVKDEKDSSSLVAQKKFDEIIKPFDKAMKHAFLMGTHAKNKGKSAVWCFGSHLNTKGNPIANHELSEPKIIQNIFKFV